MKRWLREPLIHFLLIGALLFAVYYVITPALPDEGEIVVSRGQQEHLITTFARTWQRPPTSQEFTGLVDDWIREEIAYRQGVEMGLDTNDTVIRRRLRQKVELLAEDIVSAVEPGEAQLQEWLDQNQASYMLEPRYTLEQIYFSPDRRGDAASTDAVEVLNQLRTNPAQMDANNLGDPLPLPGRIVNERQGAIAAQFGTVFIDALQTIETGEWAGPVPSGFGVHLIRIEERQDGRPLTLDEARVAVERDWSNQQRLDTVNTLYERLREQYSIIIQPIDVDSQGQ